MKSILYTTSTLTIIAGIFLSCKNKPAVPADIQGKVKIETIAIAPKIAGRIETIRVQEGQQVQCGDTLAIIAVPEIGAKLTQADGAIVAAQGQLDLAYNGATPDQLLQVQSQLDAATAQLELAEKSFLRMERMYADSLIAAQQYDEVKAKYRMAQSQVNTIKAKQKEITAGTRPETIHSAQGQVQRALGARQEVLLANKERYIIAPADMTLETITLKQGELATPGYTLFNGYTHSSTYFRFTISEKAINAYRVGQPVRITVPNTTTTLSATIVAIKQMPRYADNTSTAPNREIGESFFELKIVPIHGAAASGLFNNSTVLLSK